MLKPDNEIKTIKILWWNVNKRLDAIAKSHSPIQNYRPKIVFVLESALGYDIIPNVKFYRKLADTSIESLNHGGVVAYIDKNIFSHVFEITYSKFYIAFRLDFVPHFIFIGVYIQPINSPYFDSNMYGILSELILSYRERNLIPIIGGDINCRFGDLNHAFREQRHLYNENADTITNLQGLTYGVDMCNSCQVFPVNHLKLPNKTFTGDYTYFKADKRSQIDFLFTDSAGIKHILDLVIPVNDWHLSDHRSLLVELKADESINPSTLLRRAKDLNYIFDPDHVKPKRYLSEYNLDTFENYLRNCNESIDDYVMKMLEEENINGAIIKLEEYFDNAYRFSKIKRNSLEDNTNKLEMANKHFVNLKECINGQAEGDKDELIRIYQKSRNELSKELFDKEQKKWNELLASKDSKCLWNKIDWKGGFKNDTELPIFEDLVTHFEDLYKTPECELEKIEQLESDIYVHDLDKPISKDELEKAMKDMKNGGYDHKMDSFQRIVNVISPLLVIIMNIMFYISYPAKLAISILIAIPKKLNSLLPTNYCGIQILPAFGVLYDRILDNRLKPWIKISSVQSAFQKCKSTLHQIFTICLLIEIFKMKEVPLYIGTFDLTKAFDRVSRYKLLLKLVKLGIGNCMLQALKRIYSCTYCVLCYGSSFSRKFRTFCGVRQGAASSAVLFISFIDDIVDYLEEHCSAERIIETLHCLLHADDTAIISTDRELFKYKCNNMIEYFKENSLSLNLSKSGYMIINGKYDDHKVGIELINGVLEYKSEIKYLGVYITDSGCLKYDVEHYITAKRSNITIKFANFCRKNFLAPLNVKLTVLDTCVNASITYACETWSYCIPNSIEVMHRQGIKTALSVRQTTNNEIVYIESGKLPLEINIIKQQMKFWSSITKIIDDDPNHYIAKLVQIGENTQYIKHYKNLAIKYTSSAECNNALKIEYSNKFKSKINDA